jgi:hypothetical protein
MLDVKVPLITTSVMIEGIPTLMEAARSGGLPWFFVHLVGAIVLTLVISLVIWMYFSITKVWRISLMIQTAILAYVTFYTITDEVRWSQLKFSFANLSVLFSGFVTLSWCLSFLISIDIMIALWVVSRSPEKSSFIATLDRRLATGTWKFVNKLLDLPRTPFRNWKSTAAYALSLVGAMVLISAIGYLVMLGR